MPVVSFVSGGLFLLKDTWMQHIQVAQGRIHRSIRKVQLEHLRHSFKDGLVGAGIGHRKVGALGHRVPETKQQAEMTGKSYLRPAVKSS